MTALLLAISKGNDWGWSSAWIVMLFGAAFVSLTVFVMVERRVRDPLIDLRLVVERPFANANICAFSFGFAFYLAGVVVPIMAALPDESGYGLGYSTTRIGLVLLPTGLASIVSARAGGRLVDRLGPARHCDFRFAVRDRGVCLVRLGPQHGRGARVREQRARRRVGIRADQHLHRRDPERDHRQNRRSGRGQRADAKHRARRWVCRWRSRSSPVQD